LAPIARATSIAHSPTASRTSLDAPCASSHFTISARLKAAAIINGVRPSADGASTAAPRDDHGGHVDHAFERDAGERGLPPPVRLFASAP